MYSIRFRFVSFGIGKPTKYSTAKKLSRFWLRFAATFNVCQSTMASVQMKQADPCTISKLILIACNLRCSTEPSSLLVVAAERFMASNQMRQNIYVQRNSFWMLSNSFLLRSGSTLEAGMNSLIIAGYGNSILSLHSTNDGMSWNSFPLDLINTINTNEAFTVREFFLGMKYPKSINSLNIFRVYRLTAAKMMIRKELIYLPMRIFWRQILWIRIANARKQQQSTF